MERGTPPNIPTIGASGLATVAPNMADGPTEGHSVAADRRQGRVVLFTGPTGAGKTTTAQAWASGRTSETAWFDHDEARFLLKAGYVSRSEVAADESLRPAADRQWLLAAAVCEAMAATYVAEGVDFALSAFRPPGDWNGCWAGLDRLDPVVVVLWAPIGVALARDAGRAGRARTGEASIRRAYSYPWGDWATKPGCYVVDNSSLSVDEVASRVEQIVSADP